MPATRTVFAAGLALALAPGPAAAYTPTLAPPGGLELHWSPARLPGRAVSAFTAKIDDRRAYVRLDEGGKPIAEGVGYAPGLALGPADPRRARLARWTRYTFRALAPATRVHLAYVGGRTSAEAWVWTSGKEGPRLHFEGRADRRDLVTLVEWAWEREFRRLCGELAHAAGRDQRAVDRLPARFFR